MYAQKALRFANRVIARFGGTQQTDLLAGVRSDPWTCPIANTIKAGLPGAHVAVASDVDIDIDGIEHNIAVPASAQQFITSFDCGRQPQYEIEEEAA